MNYIFSCIFNGVQFISNASEYLHTVENIFFELLS